jgi:hypothetical protein
VPQFILVEADAKTKATLCTVARKVQSHPDRSLSYFNNPPRPLLLLPRSSGAAACGPLSFEPTLHYNFKFTPVLQQQKVNTTRHTFVHLHGVIKPRSKASS